ncbi:MAG: ABC transporter ATP-binding protein [Acidimicrobiia bacterium]|nr:ABC transporter ATP-binding protein [Acidimicrobiia bacterium]MXY73818.1 ABC transporter ATP-binding protein [Acidimicrobiia bacterium]MYA38267.1 ABC transporter ATP-binding protein [Acidimicrobiia bacterium]MYB78604.1 ABC transporter ATP-binding protein [Acidimicrobiia bacterium]MYG93029.1 ABC transporter ATP-binding protein [Acidimicrobiia bacterium]
MTQVTLSGLTKIFDQKNPPAVDNLDLEIESGKLTALLGPSGCGKTTTMKMIAGLLRPTSGDILFDGDSILSIKPEERGAVMVFQNYLLFPYMTIADNIGFGLKMRKVNKKEIKSRVQDMLDLVQLPGFEERKPNQLSGGQQQRIALARALIVQPNVLLLDEPLSNLDAHLRDEMRVLIRRIQTEMGITTVFVTHDQEEAVVLADKVALLFDGRLQQFDAPDSFYDTPNTVEIATFFGGTNFIPGYYLDGTITTDIGVFDAPHSLVPEGNAVLSIRPEAVDLGEGGENSVSGTVLSHVYAGRYARFQIRIGDIEIEAVTEPGQVKLFADGDNIPVKFDPDKIWVLGTDTEKHPSAAYTG